MATVASAPDVRIERDRAWARLHELGERARSDRAGALRELEESFRAGRASAGIDGVTEGRFVAFALQPAADRALAALARRWMPWSGKRFSAAAARGDNALFEGSVHGFGFATRVEPSAREAGHEVLVIDYAAVPRNPPPVRRIRDELVEIAPGVHLGQALWRRGERRPALVAYWALRAG